MNIPPLEFNLKFVETKVLKLRRWLYAICCMDMYDAFHDVGYDIEVPLGITGARHPSGMIVISISHERISGRSTSLINY
jgi:hypothetical protein